MCTYWVQRRLRVTVWFRHWTTRESYASAAIDAGYCLDRLEG
jgi:hypothetical protein